MNNVIVSEIRAIRDELSIKTAGMTDEQRRKFYADKASEAQKEIDEIRKKKNEAEEIPA
jgi:hypothetical protein